MRLKFRDRVSRGTTCELSAREEIEQLQQEVDALEDKLYSINRPGEEAAQVGEQLRTTRLKLNGLRFVFEDHAAHDPEGNPIKDGSNLVAVFSPQHTARAADDGLAVHGPSGNKVATFHGTGHRASVGDHGELRVHVGRTTDALTPAKLNRINERTYDRRLV